jgi:hypothetical protein
LCKYLILPYVLLDLFLVFVVIILGTYDEEEVIQTMKLPNIIL